MRQVATEETNAPSGRLTTVATETPAVMIEVARMTALSRRGGRRDARADRPEPADRDAQQHPRGDQQAEVRGESAPSTSATTSSTVSDQSTMRRSTREVRTVMTGAPIAAVSPVATTSEPGGADADVQVVGDRGQQPDREELGEHQDERPERHREHSEPAAPIRRLCHAHPKRRSAQSIPAF